MMDSAGHGTLRRPTIRRRPISAPRVPVRRLELVIDDEASAPALPPSPLGSVTEAPAPPLPRWMIAGVATALAVVAGTTIGWFSSRAATTAAQSKTRSTLIAPAAPAVPVVDVNSLPTAPTAR